VARVLVSSMAAGRAQVFDWSAPRRIRSAPASRSTYRDEISRVQVLDLTSPRGPGNNHFMPSPPRTPGRPPKYGRPARLVPLTLPEDVLKWLGTIHPDPAWAIVNLYERVVHSLGSTKIKR
jgi:hypothetical protein